MIRKLVRNQNLSRTDGFASFISQYHPIQPGSCFSHFQRDFAQLWRDGLLLPLQLYKLSGPHLAICIDA